jgi:hypothetical protein
LLHRLDELGWSEGRNLRIEYRWGAGEPDRARAYAAELVALAPHAILANGSPAVAALQQTTRTIVVVSIRTAATEAPSKPAITYGLAATSTRASRGSSAGDPVRMSTTRFCRSA